MFLKQVSKKSTAEKKFYFLIGDLIINSPEYFENQEASAFYSSLFTYGAMALINRPSRVAKKSATITDNTITTNNFDEFVKKGTIKSDLSDHLLIIFSIGTSKLSQNSSLLKIKKTFFNNNSLASIKDQ